MAASSPARLFRVFGSAVVRFVPAVHVRDVGGWLVAHAPELPKKMRFFCKKFVIILQCKKKVLYLHRVKNGPPPAAVECGGTVKAKSPACNGGGNF